MAQEERQDEVFIYDIQYYLEFANDSGYDNPEQVTEDKEFTPTRDRTEYESSYLCRKTQRKRTVSNQDSFAFTIDAVGPGGIQKKLVALEDVRNAKARLIRTCAYDFDAGKRAESTALPAKRCDVIVNLDPLDGAVGELLTIKGTAVQDSDEWEYGTFNESTNAFTPEV